MAFIFIGQVNVLAPIVSINFMLTYSFIDYSYFSVAMTFQLQTKEKKGTLPLARGNQRRSTRQSSRPLIETALPNYGSRGESPQSKGTLLEFTKDMDQIFPSISNGDAGAEKTSTMQELSSKSKNGKVTAKQKLMDSFGLDLNRNVFSEEKEEEEEMNSSQPQEESVVQCGSGEPRTREEPQIKTCHAEQDPSLIPQSSGTGDQLETLNWK